jgi:hypothetical protein
VIWIEDRQPGLTANGVVYGTAYRFEGGTGWGVKRVEDNPLCSLDSIRVLLVYEAALKVAVDDLPSVRQCELEAELFLILLSLFATRKE